MEQQEIAPLETGTAAPTHRLWGRYYCGDQMAPYGPFTVPRWRYAGQWGYIYVMRSGDRVKIGRAANPLQRLKTLQQGDPAITLYSYHRVPKSLVAQAERLCHARFRLHCIGGEWFSVTGRDAKREVGHIVRDALKADSLMRLHGAWDA